MIKLFRLILKPFVFIMACYTGFVGLMSAAFVGLIACLKLALIIGIIYGVWFFSQNPSDVGKGIKNCKQWFRTVVESSQR